MFQRFFDEGLAHASYLIGCRRTREAVVVDPRRDVDIYVTATRQHDLDIVYTIETHIHADFLSGARELAARGSRTISGPGSALGFDHHEARDGERLHIGDSSLELLHTPGHTPEHISMLVREPDGPVRVLTGDTLFVGAVGRPDLLGADQARQLAADLYDSLFDRLLALDDGVEVHPAHGAGSLCGTGIGREPHSTIGRERQFNPMLQHQSKDAFVGAVLADLPETPPYFSRMKRVNQDGPPVLGLAAPVKGPHPISPLAAAAAVRQGAVLLDVRCRQTFANGHPAGALHIAFGAKVGYWAGWLIPAGSRVVLLADHDGHAGEVRRQLLRVGLDDVDGVVDGGFEAWRAADLPTARIEQITIQDLRERLAHGNGLTVIDVRTKREWTANHIEGAIHIPVGEIPARIGEIEVEGVIATVCESGFRSSMAASVLKRWALDRTMNVRIMNVVGGMTAYRGLEPSN
jgi:hydroxyacylglutathione hydrolase